jgi:hypothetical protein
MIFTKLNSPCIIFIKTRSPDEVHTKPVCETQTICLKFILEFLECMYKSISDFLQFFLLKTTLFKHQILIFWFILVSVIITTNNSKFKLSSLKIDSILRKFDNKTYKIDFFFVIWNVLRHHLNVQGKFPIRNFQKYLFKLFQYFFQRF